jgi:hypothetical protein
MARLCYESRQIKAILQPKLWKKLKIGGRSKPRPHARTTIIGWQAE